MLVLPTCGVASAVLVLLRIVGGGRRGTCISDNGRTGASGF